MTTMVGLIHYVECICFYVGLNCSLILRVAKKPGDVPINAWELIILQRRQSGYKRDSLMIFDQVMPTNLVPYSR